MQASLEANALVTSLAATSQAQRCESWHRRSTWLIAIALLVLSACMLSRAFGFWVFTIDDAYITLRYARHLAQGLGPSWNPGAAPAEGYTTFSWMLILSLAEFLRLDGPFFAKGIGVVFALASFVMAALIVQRAGASSSRQARALGLVALFALFFCYWPLSLHAVSGMETTLSCCAFSAFFLFSSSLSALPREQVDAISERICRRLALAALLSCLTRPEAVLPCAVTLIAHLISAPARRISLVRACSLWLALPFLGYYIWRFQHFGLWFPLSFYVKATGQPLFTGWPDVRDFFAPFFVEQPWWGALLVLGALRIRALRPSLLGALAFVIFFVFPEHIMAFEGRYLLPLFPLLAATSALGLAQLIEYLRARFAITETRLALAGVGLCSLAVLPLPLDRAQRAERWLNYGRSLRAAHVALARDLASAKGQGGRIALLDVGAIGYFADWHTIDTFGLNDAHVALTRRTDVDYVLDQRPDLLVVISAQPGEYKEVYDWETPLYRAARAQNYRTLCDYEFEPDYVLQVLGRGDAQAVRGSVCSSASRPARD